MLSIDLTPSEVAQGRALPVHLDAALRAIDEDGFVIFRNAVDVAHVEALYRPMLEDVLKRSSEQAAIPDFSSVLPRRERALLFKDVMMNPIAAQVMAAAMGERVQCGMYSSNVTMPGAGDQQLHVDQAALKEGETLDYPLNCVVVNVPLVDFTLEVGATEIWPGTHRVPRHVGDFWVAEDQIIKRRAERPPVRAVMPRGSLLIRDIRLWHRGTPNQTQIVRPMIAMICNGQFDPAFDDRERIPVAGKFPKDCAAFFHDDPTVFYNVELV
jgi:ectoine hydroxylase-related dioxygenase (phytanoyl-CoA dioxygenase family)